MPGALTGCRWQRFSARTLATVTRRREKCTTLIMVVHLVHITTESLVEMDRKKKAQEDLDLASFK